MSTKSLGAESPEEDIFSILLERKGLKGIMHKDFLRTMLY